MAKTRNNALPLCQQLGATGAYHRKRDRVMDTGGCTEYHAHVVVNNETGAVVMSKVGRRTSLDREVVYSDTATRAFHGVAFEMRSGAKGGAA